MLCGIFLERAAEMQHVGRPYQLLTDSACCMQVPAAHIERLDIIPDIDAGAVTVTVLGSNASEGAIAHVSVLDKLHNEVSFKKQAS